MPFIPSVLRNVPSVILALAGLGAGGTALAQVPPTDDAGRGQVYFQQFCAICHSPTLGPGNRMDIAQPDLYAFMNDVRQRAPLSGGFAYHMAGQPMSAPRDLKWGEN